MLHRPGAGPHGDHRVKREERRQEIINLLVEHHAVDLDDLAKRFAVSKMTVHRDLDELESAGVLRKVRGGATIDAGTQFESDFRFRQLQEADVKRAIAEAALDLVEPGMTVIVNDGSMAAVLGEALLTKRPITVVTNNAAVLQRMQGESGVTLIALGGTYSDKFNAYFGLVTEEALSHLRADIAFISAPAAAGAFAYHMDERIVRAKRAMIAASRQACLMINSRRLGHTALHVLARLDEFDTVISDSTLPADMQSALEGTAVTVTIAATTE